MLGIKSRVKFDGERAVSNRILSSVLLRGLHSLTTLKVRDEPPLGLANGHLFPRSSVLKSDSVTSRLSLFTMSCLFLAPNPLFDLTRVELITPAAIVQLVAGIYRPVREWQASDRCDSGSGCP